jgi:hypothetical protein
MIKAMIKRSRKKKSHDKATKGMFHWNKKHTLLLGLPLNVLPPDVGNAKNKKDYCR